MPWRKVAVGTLVVLTVVYPLVVYWAMGKVEPYWLSLLMAALAVARALLSHQSFWWLVALGAASLAGWSWWGDSAVAVKLYPVWVSVVLLSVFAYSLKYPPSVVERLARLQEPDLPPQAVRYTERVTQMWCIFFVANAIISVTTAIWGSDAQWAMYNGLVSYVLMGLLMAGEWCVRQRVRRVHRTAETALSERDIG